MDDKIIRLPRKFSTCAACGTPFKPLQHWHQLCRDCWHWIKIGEYTMAARELLRGIGR